MFLLCNGLLVFVGITRSLYGSSSLDESFNYVEAKEPMLVVKEKINYPYQENIEGEYTKEIKYSSEEVEEKVKDINLEEGKGSSILILEQEEELEKVSKIFDEEKDKDSKMGEFMIGERVEEQEVVEEVNWMISNEELNKKFDDFIKRMKEDLRIEAQRQLVMV